MRDLPVVGGVSPARKFSAGTGKQFMCMNFEYEVATARSKGRSLYIRRSSTGDYQRDEHRMNDFITTLNLLLLRNMSLNFLKEPSLA